MLSRSPPKSLFPEPEERAPRCPNCGCYWNGDSCLFCEHPQAQIHYKCPYCHGCLNDLSLVGRENHIDWCRIRHLPAIRPKIVKGSEGVGGHFEAPAGIRP